MLQHCNTVLSLLKPFVPELHLLDNSLAADASYYLTRNSLNYVTPVMMQDKALALSYTQIGGLTSILPVAYGNAFFAVDDRHGMLLFSLTTH